MDNFFDDDFDEYTDDAYEEDSNSEEVLDDLKEEDSSGIIINPLSDPLTAAFLFGYAEEIAEEELSNKEKRKQDGEPLRRIDDTIKKVSPVSKKVSASSNYPAFFEYVDKKTSG